jgi:predicted small metal-binding protein
MWVRRSAHPSSAEVRRAFPSEMNCSITIMADTEAELVDAAAQHAVAGHGDTPELREQLRGAIRDGSRPRRRPAAQPDGLLTVGRGTTSFGEGCVVPRHLPPRGQNTARAGCHWRKPMSTTPGPSSRSAIGSTPRVNPPDLQPLLQSILAALADIDLVHASEVALVRDSDADEWLKQGVIAGWRSAAGSGARRTSGNSRPWRSASGRSLPEHPEPIRARTASSILPARGRPWRRLAGASRSSIWTGPASTRSWRVGLGRRRPPDDARPRADRARRMCRA